MDGTLAATDQVFQDTERQTSAHYGIEDTTVHQYVKESDTAWHSGSGDMNLRSIGIEHSAAPGRPATQKTILTSSQLIATLCKQYNIPCDRSHIIKHSEVFPTQCPGTIPIDQIISQANVILKGANVTPAQAKNLGTAMYQTVFHRTPDSAATAQAWGAKFQDSKGNFTPDSVAATLNNLRTYPEWKGNDSKIKGVTTQANITKLKPGVYEVE